MELFNEVPSDLPKSMTCIYGVRNTLTDGSETFDIHVTETWEGGQDIAIPCDGEGDASDILEAFEMGSLSGLVKVIEPK